MQERLFYIGQDVDKIPHIFGELQIFPVAEIEASLVFNTFDGVNGTVRVQFRRHLHIVDGADHDSVAGNGGALANFNAGSLQQDVWLDVVSCKKLFLYRIHIMSRTAGNEFFMPGFADLNRGSGWNAFGQISVAAG